MRVEPAQLIGRTSPDSMAKDRFIWVEYRKLLEKLFCFAECICWFQNDMSTNVACHSRKEFHNRLMRHADGILRDSPPENLGSAFLFQRESVIESVNQDIGINQSGHVYTDPLSSI